MAQKPLTHPALEDLKERGLINNITNEQKAAAALARRRATYIGFDPTAASLHLGNYVQINVLRLLKAHGLPTVAVLGGATGMVGDPSGKAVERTMQEVAVLAKNAAAIGEQLSRYTGARILDNMAFYKDMNVLTFLRTVGKHFNVNYMLEKEQTATRLETGISYTEFSYMLLQAYDFKCLYDQHAVSIQLGGSDQWGNITAGVEYIRKTHSEDNDAAGVTINLLTNADGKKFGKSEKGAVFLDPQLTSPFEMHQFLFNQSDEDVAKLLKALTTIPVEKIAALIAEHAQNPRERRAQRALARQVVSDIHGAATVDEIENAVAVLFKGGAIATIPLPLLKAALGAVESFQATADDYDVVELLVAANVVASKREARDLIAAKGVSINGAIVASDRARHGRADALAGEISVVKKGKKHFFLINWRQP